MAAQQSYWRYHNKPRSSRPRHVIAHTPSTREVIRQLMRKCVDDAVVSGLPHFSFPFESIDVVEVYTKRFAEAGLWFRLHNGRVYNRIGEQELGNPDDYEA